MSSWLICSVYLTIDQPKPFVLFLVASHHTEPRGRSLVSNLIREKHIWARVDQARTDQGGRVGHNVCLTAGAD